MTSYYRYFTILLLLITTYGYGQINSIQFVDTSFILANTSIFRSHKDSNFTKENDTLVFEFVKFNPTIKFFSNGELKILERTGECKKKFIFRPFAHPIESMLDMFID